MTENKQKMMMHGDRKGRDAMMRYITRTCINIDAWLIWKTVISSVARICQCRRQAVCNLHVEDDERHSVWTVLAKGGGTHNMLNHLQHKHKDWYVQKLASKDTSSSQLKIQVDDKGTVELGTVSNWSAEKRHIVSRRLAYWLVTSKRPPSLVRDTAFHEFCQEYHQGDLIPALCRRLTNRYVIATVTSVT